MMIATIQSIISGESKIAARSRWPGGSFSTNAPGPADLVQGEQGGDDGHGHQDQGLDEVAGDGRPAAADERHEHHDRAGDNDRELEIKAERRGEEDAEAVQPDAGVERAERDLQPGVELLVAAREAFAHGLERGDQAHLARARGEIGRIPEEAEGVAEEDHEDRPALAVGLAGRTGEGPGAELRHEGGGPDQPPHHLPAPAKVVAGGLDEAGDQPAHAEHEDEIENDDGVVVGGHGGAGRRSYQSLLIIINI